MKKYPFLAFLLRAQPSRSISFSSDRLSLYTLFEWLSSEMFSEGGPQKNIFNQKYIIMQNLTLPCKKYEIVQMSKYVCLLGSSLGLKYGFIYHAVFPGPKTVFRIFRFPQDFHPLFAPAPATTPAAVIHKH